MDLTNNMYTKTYSEILTYTSWFYARTQQEEIWVASCQQLKSQLQEITKRDFTGGKYKKTVHDIGQRISQAENKGIKVITNYNTNLGKHPQSLWR
jgi:hypothetical protein